MAGQWERGLCSLFCQRPLIFFTQPCGSLTVLLLRLHFVDIRAFHGKQQQSCRSILAPYRMHHDHLYGGDRGNNPFNR